MEISFINEMYSSGDGFNLWNEIFKALLSGIVAFLIAYFSVIWTYRRDKKKEREKAKEINQQTFEYFQVVTERAYRDVYVQIQYYFKLLKDVKEKPYKPPYPSQHTRNYLELFVKEIDKKDYYFSMITLGGMKKNDLIKLQSIFFYFHGVFEMLYGRAVEKQQQLDSDLRQQYKNAETKMLEILTVTVNHPASAEDRTLARALGEKMEQFATTANGRKLYNRGIELLPELRQIISGNSGIPASTALKSQLTSLLQQMGKAHHDIIRLNSIWGEELKKDYRENFLKALIDLRKQCRKINGFTFPALEILD